MSAKGSTVLEFQPTLVVSLTSQQVELESECIKLLPRLDRKNASFSSLDHNNSNIFPQVVRDWMQHQLLRVDHPRNKNGTNVVLVRGVVFMALQLFYQPDLVTLYRWIGHAQSQAPQQDEQQDDEWEDHLASWRDLPETRQSWSLLKSQHSNEFRSVQCSFANWVLLLACLAQHVALVETEHFLKDYAQTVIPFLSASEQRQVVDALQLELVTQQQQSSSSSSKTLSKEPQEQHEDDSVAPWPLLAIIKAVEEKFCSTPLLCAVLLEPEISAKLPHCCLPTVHLQPPSTTNPHWQVQTLYNHSSANNWTICRIQDLESVEDRERQVSLLHGSSCGCLRCRYEMMRDHNSPKSLAQSPPQWTVPELLTLGRYYLGTKQDLEMAQPLFYAAREQDACNLDAWHALGAMELSKNKFLAAQRIWQQAREQCPRNSTSQPQHEGLELQWSKLDAYHYLELRHRSNGMDNDSSLQLAAAAAKCEFIRIAPHVFCSSMLDSNECQNIISLAEASKAWTQGRHYAVPTRDIAIHTHPRLLEWFQTWFLQSACPMLEAQFGTTTTTASKNQTHGHCFYVHDAFVVQYDASLPSNYLPLHTDESTHSFVLALNDGYRGGGTYLGDQVVHLKQGDMLSFRGDLMTHGGEAVTRGQRYILAVFLYYDEDNSKEEEEELISSANRKDHEMTFPSSPTNAKTRTHSMPSETRKRPLGNLTDDSPSFSFGFQVS